MNKDEVAACGGILHPRGTILSKEVVTDEAHSAARVFKYPPVVNWNYTDMKTPWDVNTVITPPILTTPVRIGAGPSVSPTNIRSQDNKSPRRSIGPQEVRNAQPFDTSINGISAKHRDLDTTWIKVISRKLSDKSSSDIYLRFQMNLVRDTVLTESPNFMNLGLSSVHTSDELGYIFIPTTIIGRPMIGSNWLPPGHHIGEVTADRVSGTRPEKNYNSKSYFETRRGGVVNQYFGRQNNSMSRPPLDSTPLGTNITMEQRHQLTRFLSIFFP